MLRNTTILGVVVTLAAALTSGTVFAQAQENAPSAPTAQPPEANPALPPETAPAGQQPPTAETASVVPVQDKSVAAGGQATAVSKNKIDIEEKKEVVKDKKSKDSMSK